MQSKITHSVSEFNNELKLKGFNVFQIESDGSVTRIYNRKDFYKICLTKGKSFVHYADRSFETQGTVLFFRFPIFHKLGFELIPNSSRPFLSSL
jgi:hypothetical protein